MSATGMDFEQAGELKIGQVGIANLRVRTLDVPRLVEEMRNRVQRAPKMFERAAVVLDFGGLARTPEADSVRELIEGLRHAGVLPVALAYGTIEVERLSEQLGLPLLAKFRASYERDGDLPSPAEPASMPRRESVLATSSGQTTASSPVQPSLMLGTPVRSGQQIFAENRDLTVLTSVGAGAEVMADGSIHIYGPLRGRALAGAGGNEQARIFCREFHAELVAIAGRYKVQDEIPVEFHGKAVQIWLEDENLHFGVLDTP